VKLRITTPTGLAVSATDVRYVRAEDATGAFGIQPGHTELVTKLAVSVLTWRDERGAEHHAAVRGGVFRVRDGREVDVATREAVVSDKLEDLSHAVLARLRQAAESEATARTRAAQLHASLVRHLYRFVRGERGARGLAVGAGPEEEASP
jgi:F-type H+-transporting ATPase subunit epsilon